jgi:hypothetical protein
MQTCWLWSTTYPAFMETDKNTRDWIAAADGNVIHFSPSADGAESLARMIFRPSMTTSRCDRRSQRLCATC